MSLGALAFLNPWLLAGLAASLKDVALTKQCMKLHFREMLQPTGVWQDEIDHNIKPNHMALVQALCQHLKLKAADDDVHRLAFSISGLGIMLHVGHDVATTVPLPGRLRPKASVRQFIELAVNMPEQEPQVGQAERSISSRSAWETVWSAALTMEPFL